MTCKDQGMTIYCVEYGMWKVEYLDVFLPILQLIPDLTVSLYLYEHFHGLQFPVHYPSSILARLCQMYY